MTITICCKNCGKEPDIDENWVATVELTVPESGTSIEHKFCSHACFAEWSQNMPDEEYYEGFGEYFEDSSYISG